MLNKILFLLLVLEICFFTCWRNYFDPHTTAIIFFSLQMLIGILPIIFINKTQNETANINRRDITIYTVLVIAAIVYSFNILAQQYNEIAINPSYSDIIPQIQKFSKRVLSGEYPYAPFHDFGYEMQPTYLPAQWLPYVVAEKFKFDPRYVTFWLFALTYVLLAIKIVANRVNKIASILLLLLPILLIRLVLDFDQGIWSVTVEQLIMSYYLLVGLGLATGSRWMQVFGIVLCLMSRFSLVFWLPLYVFMLWTKEGWRRTFQFSIFIFISCLILYGPFLIKDPFIFFKAQKYYDTATIAEWTRSDKPIHLYNGLGFALYFFEQGGDVANLIAAVKKYMLISTGLLTLALGFIWWRLKEKIDFSLFAICSLKITLAVFYSFIQIPYSYLYVTPIIISLVVLFKSLNHKPNFSIHSLAT